MTLTKEENARLTHIFNVLGDIKDEIAHILSDGDAVYSKRKTDFKPAEVNGAVNYTSTGGKLDQIGNLRDGDENINIIGELVEIGKTVEFDRKNSSGEKGKVCNLTVQDSTGSIAVVLWDSQTSISESFKKGDIVEVKAWKVSSYKGKLQVALGKEGSVSMLNQEVLN